MTMSYRIAFPVVCVEGITVMNSKQLGRYTQFVIFKRVLMPRNDRIHIHFGISTKSFNAWKLVCISVP